MNKKGFTLIELLVVIVILAIIALITVPNALAMIATSQERADARSLEGALRAAEVYCMREKTGSATFATPGPVTVAGLGTLIKTGTTLKTADGFPVVGFSFNASCTATALTTMP